MLLVTTDYGYTLISAVWLIIAYTLHVPTIVVKARKRAFSPEFMKTNFA